VFGRVTYEMMSAFWPSPAAAEMMTDAAAGMNAMPKTVFSRSLKTTEWRNARIATDDLVTELTRLKGEDLDMSIFGSGSIVAQAATAGLLDDLQVMRVPVTLGGGKRLFDGIPRSFAWRREEARPFGNGNVFLRYRPG